MKKVLPAIGMAASLAATSAQSSPFDAREGALDRSSLAEQSQGIQAPIPTDAFALVINEMVRELDARWRVARSFPDGHFERGRPFSRGPVFGKVGGGGGFVEFQNQRQRRIHRKRGSDVYEIFKQYEPT